MKNEYLVVRVNVVTDRGIFPEVFTAIASGNNTYKRITNFKGFLNNEDNCISEIEETLPDGIDVRKINKSGVNLNFN